ncbi:hypothetical protein Porky_141 [Mycobacterium phage Porky]|uniref:Uncharacterized protein n=4 Tax=Kostyavirus TaxID=1623284 RepID=B5A6A1_9CAUD|nr:hypothetical protein Porky_141 [Mycobacterium phage Porky]YP_008051615.1 hypothetical protein PBI_MURPHY_138 [Mycobacterium phage Murphy]YP_008052069.1 hypothetical protein PBI_PHRUX_135 [Mycobacterium phage Phrux]YP_008430652.1 hypothetical protein GOKU_138 [Mycobacterium phage Goku]YP_008857627.1 hypothetical protein PHATBACTER_142 [Mycobacterium phage PhatBacter]YP_008858868.1 hypothetical protein HUFFLYPUFF_141 [Mycobacterium phage HufflyPuff]YP_009011893.1 hypothetical protein LILAC_1
MSMSDYKPRRCSKRWLDGDCPREVLAIMDSGPKNFDRYTVFYTDAVRDGRDVWIGYRGMSEHPSSPMGFGVSGQLRAHEVAEYRYRFKHQYIRWSDLPHDVQETVRRDCKLISESED